MTRAEEKERLATLKKHTQAAAAARKAWLARKPDPSIPDAERQRWVHETEVLRERYTDALRDVYFAAGYLCGVPTGAE